MSKPELTERAKTNRPPLFEETHHVACGSDRGSARLRSAPSPSRCRTPARCVLGVTAIATGLTLLGCAKVKPEVDFARARQLVTQSTGVEDVFDPAEPVLSVEDIAAIFDDGLTMEETLRVALMNNRRLQAEFMSIGVAHADCVQAGLLSNPILEIAAQFPEGGGRANIQTSIAQNIMEFWQIPRRKRVAQAILDETVLRIAHVATNLVADTKAAYFQAVAASRLLDVAHQNLKLVEESFEVVNAQRAADMASDLDVNLARGQLLSTELEVRRARLAAANAHRDLLRYLSVDVDDGSFVLSDELPEGVDLRQTPAELISLASESRLDVRAIEESLRARAAQIDAEKLGVIPELSLGIAFERLERRAMPGRKLGADIFRESLSNGALTLPAIQTPAARRAQRNAEIETILGPTLSLTLPIFDQNQAQIAKAQYLFLQEQKAYENVLIQIARDIRAAADQAQSATQIAAYFREQLVPQAERNLEFSTVAYTSGQSGILTLLEAQRTTLESRRAHIRARLDAAIALAELEKAIGTQLRDNEEDTPSVVAPEAGGDKIGM